MARPPPIGRSNTLAVATDQSAAPGLLAEVAITAAQLAVQQLAETALPPPARTRACRAGIDAALVLVVGERDTAGPQVPDHLCTEVRRSE